MQALVTLISSDRNYFSSDEKKITSDENFFSPYRKLGNNLRLFENKTLFVLFLAYFLLNLQAER